MGKRTIFYARVSTADQNVGLQQKQAEASGFKFDEVVIDEGVSGYALKLNERDGGKRLFDMLRKEDTLVVRWVDRLGRNYADISAAIRDFMARGVVIRTVINDMTFDGATSDPLKLAMRDAMIGFMAAMAQAQVEASKAAQKTGIAFAKQAGKYLGRKPTYSSEQIEAALALHATSPNISAIAKSLGLSRQTVYRIIAKPEEAHGVVSRWD